MSYARAITRRNYGRTLKMIIGSIGQVVRKEVE